MQPARTIIRALRKLATPDRYLFAVGDLRCLVPNISQDAFKVVLHRLAKTGELERVCRGIYLYPHTDYPPHLLLYHVVSVLRPSHVNYLSFESVLSEQGLISQVPINWIGLVSTGRSSWVRCGRFGTIEFVHTQRLLDAYADELAYDRERRLWVASPALAKADLKQSRPNALHLVQEE